MPPTRRHAAPASSNRPPPILSAGELEAPAVPAAPKPRPRPRPTPPLNLDAIVDAAITATLPALRANLRRELAAVAPAAADDDAG